MPSTLYIFVIYNSLPISFVSADLSNTIFIYIYESPREIENSRQTIFFHVLSDFACPLQTDRSPSSVDRLCSYLERFQGLEGENGFWSQKGSFLTWISQIPPGVRRNPGSTFSNISIFLPPQLHPETSAGGKTI